MEYPSYDQVEKADKTQLGRWLRFLPSPGSCAIGKSEEQFKRTMENESATMTRIMERFGQMGGWEPSTSKAIGLDEP